MERHSNVVSRLVGSASTPENLLQEQRKVEGRRFYFSSVQPEVATYNIAVHLS